MAKNIKVGDIVQIGSDKQNQGRVVSIAPVKGRAIRVIRSPKFIDEQFHKWGMILPEFIDVERSKIVVL